MNDKELFEKVCFAIEEAEECERIAKCAASMAKNTAETLRVVMRELSQRTKEE